MTTINQNTVRSSRPRAVAGAPLRVLPEDYFVSVVNSTPQAKQIGKIVVDTATNGATYTWTIIGTVQSIVADGSTSAIEIAAAIATKINSTPSIAMTVYAVSDGVDTVTITALNPGLGFTLSDADVKITSTESLTASASASDVEIGRMVIATSNSYERVGGKPLTTLLSAQVDSYAITYDASVIMTVVIEIEGERYEGSTVMATDAATSVTAVVAAVNYAMPANSVIATTNTASIVLTAEVAGKAFKSSVVFGSAADTAAAVKTTTEGVYGTDVVRMLAGVSSYTYGEENTSISDNSIVYPKNAIVKAQFRDDVWVADPGSVVADGAVYLETASGASTGLLYAEPSSTRIKLPRAIAAWKQVSTADSLAAVRLNLPV